MRRLRKGVVAKAAACVAAVGIVFAIIGGISFASGEGNEPFLGDYIEYGIICNYLNQTADMETNFVAGRYSGNGQYIGNTVSDNKANAAGEIRIGEVIRSNGENGTAEDVKVHDAGGRVYVDASVKKEAEDFLAKVRKYSKSLIEKNNFESPKATDMNNYIIDISKKDEKTVYVDADQFAEDMSSGRIQPGGLKIKLREEQTIVMNIRQDNKKFALPRYTVTVTDGKKTKDKIAQSVIWNMPNLNNLAIESDNLAATVIAPLAFVNVNTTGEGWLVCDTVVSNSGEWHMIYRKVPDVKATPEPDVEKTPKPSKTPLPTKTPDPMKTPKPTKTPVPTETPNLEKTDEPLESAPTPTAKPTPTMTAAPTETPNPEEIDEPLESVPTATPRPTVKPTPMATATPKPTVKPTPTAAATPKPTVKPTPKATATPEPEATMTPDPAADTENALPTGTPEAESTETPMVSPPGETPAAESTETPDEIPDGFPTETPLDPDDGDDPAPTATDPGNSGGETSEAAPTSSPANKTKIGDNDIPTTSLEDPDVPRAKAVSSKSKITTIKDGDVPLAPGAPETGDDTNLVIPIIIMGVSALAIVFVLIFRKKKSE